MDKPGFSRRLGQSSCSGNLTRSSIVERQRKLQVNPRQATLVEIEVACALSHIKTSQALATVETLLNPWLLHLQRSSRPRCNFQEASLGISQPPSHRPRHTLTIPIVVGSVSDGLAGAGVSLCRSATAIFGFIVTALALFAGSHVRSPTFRSRVLLAVSLSPAHPTSSAHDFRLIWVM